MMTEEGQELDDVESPSLLWASQTSDTTAAGPPSWTDRYAAGKLDQSHREMWREFDNSWVMVSELVGATLTWGGVGFLADRWLGVAPVLMSIGFVVGFSCGFYLLWGRSTGRILPPHSTKSVSKNATEDPEVGTPVPPVKDRDAEGAAA